MEGWAGKVMGAMRAVGTAGLAMTMMVTQQMQSMIQEAKPVIESISRLNSVMVTASENMTRSVKKWVSTAIPIVKETGASLEDVTNAFWQVASAGIKSKDAILDVAMAGARLAKQFGVGVRDAIDTVIAAARGFGVSMTNIEKVTGVFNQAISNSQLTLQQLGNTMEYVAPVAGAMNLKISDVSAAIAKMADQGVKGSKAGCYDEETEVLTRKGFKHFRNVTTDDELITLDPKTELIEYYNPERMVKEDFEGKMYRAKNSRLDVKVTSDHWMFTSPPNKSDFERIQAKEIKGHRRRWKNNGKWNGNSKEFFYLPKLEDNRCKEREKIEMDKWLKFLGFYLSEGHTQSKNLSNSYMVKLSQNPGEIRDEMEELINSIGYSFYSGDQIEISNKQLFSYLQQFGKKAHKKRVPEFVKFLSPDQIKIFLNTYLKGDGHGNQIYTSSEKMRDDLQELILKAGWSSTYSIDSEKGEKGGIEGVVSRHKTWTITIQKDRGEFEFDQRKNVRASGSKCHTKEEWVPYEGKIYCAIVPNHVMFIRREGKTYWCGNTALRTAITRMAAPTAKAQEYIEELGLSFFRQTEASRESRAEWEENMQTLDRLQTEFEEMEAHVKSLQEAQEEYTGRAREMSHEIEAIRLRAQKRDRELTEEEMERIEELEEQRDILRWQAEDRALAEEKVRDQMEENEEQQKTAKEAAKAAHEEYETQVGRMKSLTDIAQELGSAIREQNYSYKEMMTFLEALIGRRGLTGFVALMKSTAGGLGVSEKKLAKFGGTAEESKSTLADLSEKLRGTAEEVEKTGDEARISERMWGGYLSTGQGMVDVTAQMQREIKASTLRIAENSEAVAKNVKQMTEMKIMFDDLSAKALKAINWVGGLKNALYILGGLVVFPVIFNTASAMAQLAVSAQGATVSVAGLTVSVSTLIGVIGGITILFAALMVKSDKLATALAGLGGAMLGLTIALRTCATVLESTVLGAFLAALTLALRFGNKIDVLVAGLGLLAAAIFTVTGALWSVQSIPIVAVITAIILAVIELINVLTGHSLLDALKIITGALKTLWKAFEFVYDVMKTVINGVRDLATEIPRAIWKGIESMGSWLMDKLAGLASDIVSKLNPMNWDWPFSPPSGVGAKMIEEIGEGIEDRVTPTVDIAAKAGERIKAGVVRGAAGGAPGKVVGTGGVDQSTTINVDVTTGNIEKEADEDRLARKIADQTKKGLTRMGEI